MLPGLEKALQARKRYVDDTSETFGGEGLGLGVAGEAAARAKWAGERFIERSKSGYTGLVNQGATCYLNSLLQTLYMTPEFRRAIYSWEYDEAAHGDAALSMPYQLQRLFASMQLTARGAVSTGPLTKSFGWVGAEAFQQQDVQECMSVLFEHVGIAGAGGPLGDHIETEQSGVLTNYLHCMECAYKSEREEQFRALLLQIRGISSLEEALDRFVLAEELSGDNQYACSSCDKKSDAKKGIFLKTLPRILTLQLQRFDFDYTTFGRIKVNDPVSFPESLDMSRWIETSPEDDGGEYELFSIMNHTGTALGGHYFAYIKDVTTGKWFCFNDSSVSPINEAELRTAMGQAAAEEAGKGGSGSGSGDAKKADASSKSSGPEEKPVVNSKCNAYMLVYRRVVSGTKLTPAAPPAALKEEIEKDNARYVDLKKEYDYDMQLVKVRVWYAGKSYAVKVHQDEPVGALVEAARALLIAEGLEVPPSEQCRLREYDTIKNIALRPLPDSGKRLKEAELRSNQVLQLETREPDAQFPEWVDGGLPLLVTKLINADTGEYDEPRQILVVGDPTIEALQNVVEPLLDLEGKCRMVALVGEDPVVMSEPTKLLTTDIKIMPGDVIRVEECSDFSTPSRIVELYENLVNSVEIIFNRITPETEEGETAARACARATISVDQRQPLGDVKALLAAETGVPIGEFKIKRPGAKTELKDLEKPLLYFGLLGGGQLALEKGRPLVPGEFSLKVSLYAPELEEDKEESKGDEAAAGAASAKPAEEVAAPDPADKPMPFKELGTIVVTKDTPMLEVKAAVAAAFGDAAPPANRMRIRDRANRKLTKAYIDTVTIGDNIRRLTDGKEIVVQRTAAEETFTEDHLLLSVRRWHPVEFKLDDGDERAMQRSMTTAEFADLMAAESGIAKDDIAIAKPWTWQLKSLDNVPKLKWTVGIGDITLGGKNLRLKHGDVLLFKDKSKAEKFGPDEDAPTLDAPAQTAEAGFKIYTREEMAARAAEMKAKEEADEKERAANLAMAASITTSGRPEVAKYVKLLKLGMSKEQVLQKMTVDGIDPSLLDA